MAPGSPSRRPGQSAEARLEAHRFPFGATSHSQNKLDSSAHRPRAPVRVRGFVASWTPEGNDRPDDAPLGQAAGWLRWRFGSLTISAEPRGVTDVPVGGAEPPTFVLGDASALNGDGVDSPIVGGVPNRKTGPRGRLSP